MTQQIYCSLDIETSGFDPLKDEILEVGFVKFQIKDSKFKIGKEWTRVFKASKEVHPSILALTGITQKELDEAPNFSEHHQELQKELEDAVIVGHNIEFDIRFLESFGIKTSGKSVDTLQLSQFILPTRHSYNLESLMHFFGVAHKEAHRALADSKAALKVLEKLLGVYQGFGSALKEDIRKLAAGQEFYWKEFLDLDLPVVKPSKASKPVFVPVNLPAAIKIKGDCIYAFPQASDYLPGLLGSLAKAKEKFLAIVPKTSEVYALWKAGLCEPVFRKEDLFNPKKADKFLSKKALSLEETVFALKVAVWKETNWQSETILDLNLSFFGGQFKEVITGAETVKARRGKLLCTDHETFISLENKDRFKDRLVIIAGLSEFEQRVSGNISVKVSWGFINYALKAIYNPEYKLGDVKLKAQVEEALNATDLFFGLVHALLSGGENFSYVKVLPDMESSVSYNKIQKASRNYIEKLSKLNKAFKSQTIESAISSMEGFFKQEENRVKWLEFAPNRCSLNNAPIDIRPLVKTVISGFRGIAAVDDLGADELYKYYKNRLGFEGFSQSLVSFSEKPAKQDLFSFLKPPAQGKVDIKLFSRQAQKEDISSAIKDENLPAVILLPSVLAVRDFQTENYDGLASDISLLVQNSSGGSNKLLRNFSINPKTLLAATDKLVLKYLKNNRQGIDAVRSLPVKTLVICRLPFEQFTHPYYEALAETYGNSFVDFSLPLALNNFHNILKFFWTPVLKTVFFYDSKLSKDYAKVFKNYLESLPGAVLEER